mmetsp:Transcript_10501/g.32117  ORF Transcript_10501/g.32117 Transcript_10501/m.32117 type:complete len:304 (-) Transcript_10501:56-967(-)
MSNRHRWRQSLSLCAVDHGMYLLDCKPSCGLKFLFVDANRGGLGLGQETQHQRVRKGPRLGRVIAAGPDSDACLLENLPPDGILTALSVLHEAGQSAVHPRGPLRLSRQQTAVPRHDHGNDDGIRSRKPHSAALSRHVVTSMFSQRIVGTSSSGATLLCDRRAATEPAEAMPPVKLHQGLAVACNSTLLHRQPPPSRQPPQFCKPCILLEPGRVCIRSQQGHEAGPDLLLRPNPVAQKCLHLHLLPIHIPPRDPRDGPVCLEHPQFCVEHDTFRVRRRLCLLDQLDAFPEVVSAVQRRSAVRV